jgi:hypothetical protein
VLVGRLLLPESSVGQRRIGREGVILVAGLRGDAVLAAKLERIEPLAVAGEGLLHDSGLYAGVATTRMIACKAGS